MRDLSKRQIQLLRCVIQSHIQTAAAISSDYIARLHDVTCSPATIRNEMVALESMGYLQQPYTSAGRIPTDKAYRLYVNSLIRMEPLSSEEEKRLNDLASQQGDIHVLLEQATIILGQITHELAVVLSPSISHARFDRMELLRLTEQKVLVILHIHSRSVRTLIMQIKSAFNTDTLNRTASFLNERLSGLTLDSIKNSIRDRCRDSSNTDPELLQIFIDSAGDIFKLNEPQNLRTAGTNNILSQPEFSDKGLLESLFRLLDDRRSLSAYMQNQKRPFQVTIGKEHTDERLMSFSTVSAQYQIGTDAGSIGIIGPKRMRYSKIMPLVKKTAKSLSLYIE
jgi:heat-inducible transcriptional repressor